MDKGKKTRQDLALLEKARGDVEIIELHVYNLVRFSADIQMAPDHISAMAEILKKVQDLNRSVQWSIDAAKRGE